jgi:AraC-like DNA-binding protein
LSRTEIAVAVEAALRGSAVALLVLLAALALREARAGAAARYGVLFSLSVAAYVIESAPFAAIQHALWIVPVRLVSIGTPAVFWLWACAHFDDEFIPDRRRWLAWFGLVALGAAAMALDRSIIWHGLQAATLLFAGLGLWEILGSRGIDLVENRRRSRVMLAIGAALYIVVINLGHLLPNWLGDWWPGSVVNAAGLAAISFAFAVLSLARDNSPAAASAAVLPSAPQPQAASVTDGHETAWLAALRRAMEDDKIYREEGFGIAALAARLDIPEYRLRRLINQRLGHRNFTAFVNTYRLAETIAALADPGQADVPILTIALDAGFQSLGPFNRAFKAQVGTTPSEFRRQAVGRQVRAAE